MKDKLILALLIVLGVVNMALVSTFIPPLWIFMVSCLISFELGVLIGRRLLKIMGYF